jgi:TIR domain
VAGNSLWRSMRVLKNFPEGNIGVFVSYRRQDSQSAAGRLTDYLEREFGTAPIFRDVDTIEPGVDFADDIERALSSCKVFLALIGPRWLTITDARGQRRLDDPDDWIRLETSRALKRKIRVIPVLVESASLPTEADLPEDLRPLVRLNTHELSDKRWDYDVQQLATILERIGIPRKPAAKVEVRGFSKAVKFLAWVGGVFLLLILLFAMFQESTKPPTRRSGPDTAAPNEPTPQTAIFPPGYVMQTCGCWGVNPAPLAAEPRCQNQSVHMIACQGFCPGGGVAYAYVCQ